MSLRRRSMIMALAAALPTAALAGLTQTLVNTLPEQPAAGYTQELPSWIARAKDRPSSSVGGKLQTANVMIAPVVFNWAPENTDGRGFPPWWITGEKTGGVQSTVNDTHRKIVDAFRARNWGFYTPAWLREQGAVLDKVGEKPISVNGRAYGGGTIGGYPYVSEKLRQWDQGDFLRLTSQYQGPQAVAMIQLNTIWIYKGHSRMNGEAIVNYDVYTSGTVKVCGLTRCINTTIGPDNALKAMLPVPAEKAVDENRRRANNDFAIGLASDYFSGVVVTILEDLLDASTLAVAPPAPPEPKLISTMHGKCIDVPYGKFVAGTVLQVWDCGQGNPNQVFAWAGAQIKAGGLCVDALGGAGKAGDPIALSACSDTAASQKWALKDGRLRGVADRCIGIGGASQNNGATLVLWDCTGAPDQGWRTLGGAAAAAVGATLEAPATLNAGQRLLSKDGRFELTMQDDGNLVLYRTSDGRPLWASGTDGKGAALATMQKDGNLVLYKVDGAPVWSTDTWNQGATRAVMQDDGNFVLYKANGTPVWASGTCCY